MNGFQSRQNVLIAREFEVLKLIALALLIEERTIRFHVENILDKLKVKNRAEARCYACRQGWIKN